MASSKHNLPSPDISDVMSLLCAMKKQNEEILAQNKEILTKLNSIEDDNRKLTQELHEIRNSQKYNDNVSSKKRDVPEDATKSQNEPSDSKNKRARVSVARAGLPQPEPPASFDTLDDDCLGNVLDFVGKSCYSVFGLVNKRCHEMFCSKGLSKKTYLYGYGPLHLIQQKEGRWESRVGFSKGVRHFNRRDVLCWMMIDGSDHADRGLKWICFDAIQESRLDILCEVFDGVNEQKLEYLRDPFKSYDLCYTAAEQGNLDILKLLRENECGWDKYAWREAKLEGHEHILEYLRDNDYPTEWQYDTDGEIDIDRGLSEKNRKCVPAQVFIFGTEEKRRKSKKSHNLPKTQIKSS